MQTELNGRPQAMIAMSGGVDSSVAAYLMQQAGYDCMGVTMKLYENEDAGVPRGHTCCALDDVEDARRVAYALGMPYYVFNYKDAFREQVMARFAAAYQRGATPNPCLDCNRYLKFGLLESRARALGCEVLATGHYARIEQLPDGRYTLRKAVDASKDQSYVLAWLTQEQLAHTRFPLGGLHKTEAREIAEAHGFCNAHKHDSQDICFVPDGDYAAAVERLTGTHSEPGRFVDTQGKVLGTHRGIIHYTIGQRRGLGIAAEAPLYVCGIDVPNNEVVLGRNEELFSTELDASGCNWISGDVPGAPPARDGPHPLPAAGAAVHRHGHGSGHGARVVRDSAARHHARPGRRVLRRGHGARRRHDRLNRDFLEGRRGHVRDALSCDPLL